MQPKRRRLAVACIQAIESRLMFNANYVALSSGTFAQNWTNTGLISADDNWSNVPGIVGFRGDGLVSSTGVNPQTITGPNATVMVTANQTTTTTSTAGVREFDGLANPVVAIKGSSSSNAPYLAFYLDTTGVKDVSIAYNLRDVDTGSNNSIQQVALQYRIGETGNWINLPAGYVSDASDGPTLTKTTAVAVALPAGINNQSKVQLRVITTDAVGNDEYIGVDDISITSTLDITVPTGVMLNEVNINPPSAADGPFEFVELKGGAGQTISNCYLLAINGDSFDAGTVIASIPLNNVTFGSNGLLLIKAASGGFASEDAATTVLTTSKLNSEAFYNGSFTIALVFSPTAISDFAFLDADQNGTLESLPGGSQIIDAIGWKSNVDPSANDQIYGADLTATPYSTSPVIQPPLTLDAATRIAGNTTLNSAAAWYYGDLNNTGLGNQTKAYNTVTGFGMPSADARTTPGAANFSVGAPEVQSTSYAFDQTPSALLVDFSKNVGASLVLADDSTSSFILTNRDAGVRIEAAKLTKTFGAGDIATLKFPGMSGNGINGTLPDANYRLTVVAANVKDATNANMTADVTYDFFVLAGDANRDRKVNTLDFNVLAANFGNGGQVFSRGDFNYSTVVDSTDFDLFVAQYGKSLAAIPAPVASSPLSSAPSLFGSIPVDENDHMLNDLV